MKIESCRRCGKEPDVTHSCSFCREPIQFHCKHCGMDSEAQIHLVCFQSGFEEQVARIRDVVSI